VIRSARRPAVPIWWRSVHVGLQGVTRF